MTMRSMHAAFVSSRYRRFARGSASLVLLIAMLVVAAGGYYWTSQRTVCDRTLQYSLGLFNSRFGITDEEFLDAIRDAERLWERGTGLELLEYDVGASFTINLVFDERQAEALALRELEKDLGTSSESISSLQAQYDVLHRQYETRIAAYEAEVAAWNNRGGAPPDEFQELQQERRSLESMRLQINSLARRINAHVDDHNTTVEAYNSRVGGEFTQGDYVRDRITIYQFDDRNELVLVLAHELGHALGIEHVERDASSIMYRLMGEQDLDDIRLTAEDVGALKVICGIE